jgi:hypothetical protein
MSAFAVQKMGWPPLEPKPGAIEDASEGFPLRRFASPRALASLDRYAAAETAEEKRFWSRVAVTRAERSRRLKRSKGVRNELESLDDGSSVSDPDARFRLCFSAWTEEAGIAAGVMQSDYHLTSKHVMASALATAHAPFLAAAPVAEVFRRRLAFRAARRSPDPPSGPSGARRGQKAASRAIGESRESARPVGDLSMTSKPAVLRSGDVVGRDGDAAAAKALRALLHNGDREGSHAESRNARARARKRNARAGKRNPEKNDPSFAVSVLPGEMLAFVEILCEARVDDRDASRPHKRAPAEDAEADADDEAEADDEDGEDEDEAEADDEDGEDDEDDDASRYENRLEDETEFDPDEPL